jgi:hypothetical protein
MCENSKNGKMRSRINVFREKTGSQIWMKQGGAGMKTVVIAFQNRLMAQSVAHTLNAAGCFHVHMVDFDSINLCQSISADVLLLEATGQPFKPRPAFDWGCKIVVMCDDNSSPERLQQVVLSKKLGEIDDFVFFSVGEHYLTAMLSAL